MAAGQQLVHGANPYDSAQVLGIERAAGYAGNWPDMLLNMPMAFFLFLPLGMVGAKTGLALWLMAFVACLMVSIKMLWVLHGRPQNSLHLLAFLFAPVLVCMNAGQLGAFILLGVVLFLYFHRSRPFLAGAALLLSAVKPHLFLPFGIVLVAWAFHRKAYRVLAGIATALAPVARWRSFSTLMRGENTRS